MELSRRLVGRSLDSVTPAARSEVMGTAIVSIALSLDGQETLSRVLLGIAAAMWLTFSVLLPLRFAHDLARFRADARTPAALTLSVSTAVLGTRLTLLGWTWAGIATLVLAFVAFAVFLGPVLSGWMVPTVGGSLLLAVAPQSLAVLAATLAGAEHARWLVIAALALFGLGLACYVFVISRFDSRQLAVGRGDHWIAGGGLAIAALAGAKISADAKALAILGGGEALKDISLGVWVLAMLWLVVLLVAEARWPRLRYDARRWSTVFPLGMYAASSFALGALVHSGAITSFARVWVWVALGLWAIIFVVAITRAVGVLEGTDARDAAAPDGRASAEPVRVSRET